MKNQLDTSLIRLKGFDRRGCVASLNSVTPNSFKLTGEFNDPADFLVFWIHRALDRDGHLYTNKYLPSYDLSGVVLDFDLGGYGFQTPSSTNFQSVPWGKVSYILKDGTSGVFPLNITSTTGGSKASKTFTVNSPGVAAFDRVQLIYLGNTIFDYVASGGETTSAIASNLAGQINLQTNISAAAVGSDITISYKEKGTDGNNVAILEMHKNVNTTITPSGNSYLASGTNPTATHITLDFSGILGFNATQVQELWITVAPIVSTTGNYSRTEFEYQITNWSVSSGRGIEYAVPATSVVTKAVDYNVEYLGTWESVNDNWYLEGIGKRSSSVGDQFKISYYCQSTHDLYLSLLCGSSEGYGAVQIDGGLPFTRYSSFNISPAESHRQLITTSLPGGKHDVIFTILSGRITFDFLHAVVSSPTPYSRDLDAGLTAAFDFDTGFTYGVSPGYAVERHLGMGLGAGMNLYGGVFFAHRRIRVGGFFPTVTGNITGPLDIGDSFGGGSADTWFVTISGVTLGAATFPQDTVTTIAQRLVNAINSTFVAVRAFLTGSPGIFKIEVLSPSFTDGTNFTFSSSYSSTSGSFVTTGSLNSGNEGIWGIDAAAVNPLTKGYSDYVTDLKGILDANGISLTISHSQELLAPPDAGGAGTTWIQRTYDDKRVLTATGFGLWGSGFVKSFAGSTVEVTGHGYYEGYRFHGANGFTFYAFIVDTVVDSNHFTVGTRLDSGSSFPTTGDSCYVELQTSQCAFSTEVGNYLGSVYSHLPAGTIKQLGEIFHWFFPTGDIPSMAFYDYDQNQAALIALGRGVDLFVDPDSNPSRNSYADADFLRTRLVNHLNLIISAAPGDTWEILHAYDVCYKNAYQTPNYPFPIGGALNLYINFPPGLGIPGSIVAKYAQEALAWSTSYGTIDKAKESIQFPITSPNSWVVDSNLTYFIPLQNGNCFWPREYFEAKDVGIERIVFWAGDHIVLLSWDLEKELNAERKRVY